eukprot:TRINITY_DN4500_c0_g1_i1.p1 TRINITY_DN4500_c0_g1~~TRINITY_DN4500_c0_g1_i1.p1  ORF type:complete len:100 (+),score=3.39 TRINITY_DN4500_c0_g1_i1:393-692(+)
MIVYCLWMLIISFVTLPILLKNASKLMFWLHVANAIFQLGWTIYGAVVIFSSLTKENESPGCRDVFRTGIVIELIGVLNVLYYCTYGYRIARSDSSRMI